MVVQYRDRAWPVARWIAKEDCSGEKYAAMVRWVTGDLLVDYDRIGLKFIHREEWQAGQSPYQPQRSPKEV